MRLRGDLKLRKFGEEFIIVDPGQDMIDLSKVYTLNETAAFLWEKLQNREFDIKIISEILLENYHVDTQKAEIDAKKLISYFVEGGLVIQ